MYEPRKKTLVALDFDGVICDSFTTALSTYQLADPLLTAESFCSRFTGNPNFAAPIGDGNFDFFAHYGPLVKNLPLFTGMDGVITELAKQHTLVIISSTISAPIQEFLTAHHLLSHFSDVLGNDKGKKKDIKLRHALESNDIAPDRCVFITDTLGDLKEGQAAQVHTIAATWGYHDPELLIEGHPERVADTPAMLLDFVAELLS